MQEIEDGVERVVRDRVDAVKGEGSEMIYKRAGQEKGLTIGLHLYLMACIIEDYHSCGD